MATALQELDIVARDSGRREATTALVYLSGLGERGDVFARLILAPALADLRHIILDYVDWSKSTAPSDVISFVAVADRIAAWIAEAALPRVVLVGHSMGGVIAQILAERHPRLVAKLVDVEGNISRDDCTFSGKALNYLREASVIHAFEKLQRLLRDAPDARTRGHAEGLRKCAPTTYYAYAEPLVRISEAETLADRLAKLPLPALYIAGDEQRGISARSREMLASPPVRFKSVEDAGHWPYLDQPDRFIDLLRAFVEG